MDSYGSSHILPPPTKPHMKSSSFLAVPRTKSVVQTPGVGTYRPNYQVISKHVPMPSIVQHSAEYQVRRQKQQQQQSHICLKAIKSCNFPHNSPSAQSRSFASTTTKSAQVPTKFHSTEMSPFMQPASKGINFKRTYLPNGRAVDRKSLEDQREQIKQLHIVDWKRPPYPYETEFEGECYHLVRNQSGFLVLKNDLASKPGKGPDFTKTSGRTNLHKSTSESDIDLSSCREKSICLVDFKKQ